MCWDGGDSGLLNFEELWCSSNCGRTYFYKMILFEGEINEKSSSLKFVI